MGRITDAQRSEIADFVAERGDVLRSLDVGRLIAFHQEHNPGVPAMRREVAEIAMHKARVHDVNMTADEVAHSVKWLTYRGYSAGIGGPAGRAALASEDET